MASSSVCAHEETYAHLGILRGATLRDIDSRGGLQSMSDGQVVDAVRGLQELIEADGGAFECLGYDPAGGVISLRLILDRVTCEECILPPEMLREVTSDYMRRRMPGLTAVQLEDPREPGLSS
jgi:hypothetical protein